MKHFDAIIIGTGQAGPSLAGRFSAAGKTVAVIERHKFGGTCVNTGCIPTKTMVASAYAAHIARIRFQRTRRCVCRYETRQGSPILKVWKRDHWDS